MTRKAPTGFLALACAIMTGVALFMAAVSTRRFAFESKETERRFWVERLAQQVPDPPQSTLSQLYSLGPEEELIERLSSDDPALVRAVRDILWNIWWQGMGPEASSQADEAQRLLEEGAPENALAIVEDLARENPDHPEILALRGRILIRLGRPDEAARDLRRAIERNSLHWPSYEALIRIAESADDPAAAIEPARRLAEIFPGEERRQRRLERILEEAGRPRPFGSRSADSPPTGAR